MNHSACFLLSGLAPPKSRVNVGLEYPILPRCAPAAGKGKLLYASSLTCTYLHACQQARSVRQTPKQALPLQPYIDLAWAPVP